MENKYDAVIAGAGAAGATAARALAEKGEKVLVIEKRPHIAGNCYDEKDEHGVLIHTYGPHIFHTNDEDVFKFLSRFTKWRFFSHEVLANIYGKKVPVPFNFQSVDLCFSNEKSARIKQKLTSTFPDRERVPIMELRNYGDPLLKEVADYIYDNIFKFYTQKMWDLKLEELDPSVGARVPISLSYNNSYFGDKYQGLPEESMTAMFEKILNHKNIEVRLNTDIKDVLKLEDNKTFLFGEEYKGKVIYTGAIDSLFDYKYGDLPYRTLKFKLEYHDEVDYFQEASVVNYTVSEDFTRITEFKKLTGQNIKGTTIMKEYPAKYDRKIHKTPYYAINSEESTAIYGKYKEESEKYSNLIMLGRLAEYKYYNIDQIVGRALQMFK